MAKSGRSHEFSTQGVRQQEMCKDNSADHSIAHRTGTSTAHLAYSVVKHSMHKQCTLDQPGSCIMNM